MIYKVIAIQEDIDFGCEERNEDTPVMAVVILQDENGESITRKVEDQYLYEQNINEGDSVYFDEEGLLHKQLTEEWTKNCTSQTVDIARFVDKMEQVKAGKEVDWICPFCGDKVELLEQEGKHSVIGCTSCDMRITLDN